MIKKNAIAIWLLFFFVISTRHSGHKPENVIVPSPIIKDDTMFLKAIDCIKKHEGWHTEKHFPYIGYGHKILEHEKDDLDYTTITEDSATDLLNRDLLDRCRYFREFGKDSLLLATLAYNVGVFRLLGTDKIPTSKIILKLRSGDRDIYDEYISFHRVKGKPIESIKKRRITEFNLLYNK